MAKVTAQSATLGILTSGGDCAGLNAVIRAAVRKGIFHYGDEFLGFLEFLVFLLFL